MGQVCDSHGPGVHSLAKSLIGSESSVCGAVSTYTSGCV